MTNGSVLPNELAIQQAKHGVHLPKSNVSHNRRDIMANNASLHAEIVGAPLTHFSHHIV